MRVALTPPALKRDRFCTVVSVTDTGDGDLVSFEGIDDLTAAEGITGCYVLANRDDFELDSLDAAYTDLMGREVVDERFGSLGTIVEIMSTPANDVWVVEGDRYGEVLIPVIEQVVLDLPDKGTISVHVMDGLIDMTSREDNMLIETLSVFPEMFEPVMSTSILGRARKAGLFDFKAYNLRDWTHDRHRTVDDEPYGGGQGMLMKVEPIAEAIEAISSEGSKPTVVFFTPCGEPFTQHVAERLLKSERLLFVCSRYEGVDERAYAYADERLSIGDYVLTGGELPAMVVADAVARQIPGALGDEMSNVDESFSTAEDGGLLEYAQFTRPAEFNGEGVPPVLVSGDHAKVDAWRRKNAIERTCRWRPDLIETARLTPEERAYAQEILDASYSQSEE